MFITMIPFWRLFYVKNLAKCIVVKVNDAFVDFYLTAMTDV